jgi:hypothetical protein
MIFTVTDGDTDLDNVRSLPVLDEDATPTPAETPNTPIPDFEGQEVSFTKGKITSVSGLEIGDQVFRMDETVRMVVESRVIGIDHKVNATTGKLERVHLMKALDSVVIAWDLDLDQLRGQR